MPFNETCVIYREDSTKTDDWGIPTKETLYDDVCNYQIGTSGGTSMQGSMYLTEPHMFLPEMINGVKQGDKVTVTKANGSVVTGIIEQVDSQNLGDVFGDRYAGIEYTEIWLIQDKT